MRARGQPLGGRNESVLLGTVATQAGGSKTASTQNDNLRPMAQSDATLLAAIIAAAIAGLGLAWSLISYFLTRRDLRTESARDQWQRRFQKAHDLAMSSDMREAESGKLLMQSLAQEKWITDEDKATAVSILLSLEGESSNQTDQLFRSVRTNLLSTMSDRKAAAELARSKPGPRGRYELYLDRGQKYRWRLKAGNGNVIALGSEGYPTRDGAINAINLLRKGFGDEPIVEPDKR